MSGDKVLVASMPVEAAMRLFREQAGPSGPSASGHGRGRGRGRGQNVKHGRVTKHRSHHQNTKHQQEKLQKIASLNTPLWNGWQVIGDSILTRMLENYTDHKAVYDPKLKCKRLGYLLGGQTVCQLMSNIHEKKGGPIASKVLVMIGTNDETKHVPMKSSLKGLKELLSYFAANNIEFKFCLVPPVPRNNVCFPSFNNVLKEAMDEKCIIDTNSIYLKGEKGKEVIDIDLFNMKHSSGKVDGVHPNRNGLKNLYNVLEKELLSLVEQELMDSSPE